MGIRVYVNNLNSKIVLKIIWCIRYMYAVVFTISFILPDNKIPVNAAFQFLSGEAFLKSSSI